MVAAGMYKLKRIFLRTEWVTLASMWKVHKTEIIKNDLQFYGHSKSVIFNIKLTGSGNLDK